MPTRQAALVVLFFGLFYTLTNSFRTSFQMPDEEYVLLVTANIVNGRPLHLPDNVPRFAGASQVGKDGQLYSSYQIGQSLLYAPFYFAAHQILAFSEPYDPNKYDNEASYETWLERETRRYLNLCPTLFAAVSCGLFFLFAMGLGFSERTALVTTLLYGVGTMVWPYSKYLFTEASQNTLLLGVVYLLHQQRLSGRLNTRWMVCAGAAFGLLLSIRAVFIVLLPVLALYWFVRNRDRRLVAPIVAFVAPMLLGLVPQLVYDFIRFGDIFSFGYKGGGGFSTPLYVGLFGYLASPGKSFFVYAPITLLGFFGIRALFRRAPTEMLLFGAILLLVPLKYAAWWVWSGDPAWGPRYLLVLTPFLMFPAAEVVERSMQQPAFAKRGLIALLFAGSLFIQVLAVMVHYSVYLNYAGRYASFIPRSYLSASPLTEDGNLTVRDRRLDTEFIPEYSPVLGQWWTVKALLSGSGESPKEAPWRALGISDYIADRPLRPSSDLWIINLFEGGFEWVAIKGMLGAIAMLIVCIIVGQELFLSVFWKTD